MNRNPTAVWLGLAAAGLLAACAHPQMSRIEQNRAVYESWPIDVQQAILDGKVEPGMTPEMVRMAWGKPSEVNSESNVGQETWLYRKGGTSPTMIDPGGGMMGGGMSGMLGGGYPRGGGSSRISGGIGGGTMGGGQGVYVPGTPGEVREIVFRDGVVYRADPPFPK